MKFNSRTAALLAVAAAALLPATGAKAQWYSSVSRQPPPLYPYAVPNDRPYAVEVAPGTYVIQRPAAARPYPYVNSRRVSKPAVQDAPARKRSKTDPTLVEELRQRAKPKSNVINTTKIVRKKPIVIETKRYVDDPPRVVERYNVVEDKPARGKNKRKSADKGQSDEKRVIEADAQITILGPDRMSIRLFRKGGKANASADE